jgi:RNA recognition motif. (a.k.a. RRM, RBD, or RNP domain)
VLVLLDKGTMAEELDDDLNAFFDDVQEVEASAVTDKEEKLEKPPPAKRHKKDAAPARPRGVVVAAASNKTVKSIEAPSDRVQTAPHPPQPPPPAPAPIIGTSLRPAPPIHSTCINEATLPEKDFRLFAGNLDPATNDDQLFQHFAKYPSLNHVRVIRDNKGNSKGYGFASFSNALECARALREQDQTWLGSRPIRVKRYIGTDKDSISKSKGNKRGKKR